MGNCRTETTGTNKETGETKMGKVKIDDMGAFILL